MISNSFGLGEIVPREGTNNAAEETQLPCNCLLEIANSLDIARMFKVLD